MKELTTKEWNNLLDIYLTTETIDIDMWEKLDNFQKDCIHEIKKSLNRIKNKA